MILKCKQVAIYWTESTYMENWVTFSQIFHPEVPSDEYKTILIVWADIFYENINFWSISLEIKFYLYKKEKLKKFRVKDFIFVLQKMSETIFLSQTISSREVWVPSSKSCIPMQLANVMFPEKFCADSANIIRAQRQFWQTRLFFILLAENSKKRRDIFYEE